MADLETLVRRLVRVQRISLDRDVELATTSTLDGRCAYASPTKVEQIVLNLISNASDALREAGDGGTIVVACRPGEGRTVEVEVADDGPGIPEQVLPRVFEPFVATKGEDEGTGLGLAISRRLAQSMDGNLRDRNRPAGGASFVLSLPGVDPASDEGRRAAERAGKTAPEAGPGPGRGRRPATSGPPSSEAGR